MTSVGPTGDVRRRLCLPPLSLAFCNGNQRFVLNRHRQRSADCLKSEISKDLYRAAVMSPKLEMRAVEQLLFTISFILSLFCQGTLLNHPSTPRSWHPHGAPLPTAGSDAPPPHPTPAFSVSTLWCTPRKSAYLKCRRAAWQSLPLLLHRLPRDKFTSPKQQLLLTLISYITWHLRS